MFRIAHFVRKGREMDRASPSPYFIREGVASFRLIEGDPGENFNLEVNPFRERNIDMDSHQVEQTPFFFELTFLGDSIPDLTKAMQNNISHTC